MYQKILVPLDGSKLAECVVEHVKAIATGCRVPTVVLLRVVQPNDVLPEFLPDKAALDHYLEAEEKSKDEVKNYLSETAKMLKAKGTTVETHISEGLPADEILNYAEEKGVDLIIMSTHGRSGVSRWFFGSVADRVVRQSLIPVLTVTPSGCRIRK
jgi:nucleotide-binding universal stress UspA family protein